MNNQTTQPANTPIRLPALIANVRRVRGGYQIYFGGKWHYYAAAKLNEQQKADLEDWLEEVKA